MIETNRSWIAVCSVDDIPPLEARRVAIEGHYVGIFRTEEGFHAIGDVCPHMGGPLSDGDVAATTVSCPLHARKVCLRTGEVENGDLSRVLTFEVEVRDNMVYVDASALKGA